MRFNATLAFILYLLGVALWGYFLHRNSKIQRAIHRIHLGPALQWYTLLLVGCAAITLLTLYEFFGSDGYWCLDGSDVDANLERSYNLTIDKGGYGSTTLEEFKEIYAMKEELKMLSMLSIVGCVPVLVVAAVHVFVKFAHPGMRIVKERKEIEASMAPWWPAPRMTKIIVLMLMPVLLSAMSMRGSCRIWALTTGEVDKLFLNERYDRVNRMERALYHIDQEVGQLFQFVSVFVFLRLCSSFLNEALGEVTGMGSSNSNLELAVVATEFKQLVRYAGFLGLWAFILVGSLRCLLDFFVEEAHYHAVFEDSLTTIQMATLEPLNIVFSFLTIMCVVNMYIVGRTQTIKDRLGNANLKFMGARLLLLMIAVQETILSERGLFEKDSDLHKRVAEKAKALNDKWDFEKWALTDLQADLLQLSLLNLECLIAVVFNAVVWRDLDLTGVAYQGYPTSSITSFCADEAPSEPASSFPSKEGAPLLPSTDSSGQS